MANLVLKDVTYRYKNSEAAAVSNMNCEFTTGRLYAVVGPSGSGKSTLLSLLSGLDAPTEGEILFNGIKLNNMDLDHYRREDIAMIFQMFHLFPLLTVLENVCYPLELCGVKPSSAIPRAKALLESVGITPEEMKRFPSNLSGGQQQRVAIARSLAVGAKILLADEPTGNLDAVNTKNIMEILLHLTRQEDYCVIVVTHDMEVAEMADLIIRMRDGELITS
jgi:putative ABC transport system ATP-binding protein